MGILDLLLGGNKYRRMTHDELRDLINAYAMEGNYDMLEYIAEEIRFNRNLTEHEKNSLWELIDRYLEGA